MKIMYILDVNFFPLVFDQIDPYLSTQLLYFREPVFRAVGQIQKNLIFQHLLIGIQIDFGEINQHLQIVSDQFSFLVSAC